MTVETGVSFIKDLNENYPRRGDLIKEGDDHMRLIKAVLKTTLPSFDRTVNMTAESLNRLNTGITLTDGNIKLNWGLEVVANQVLDMGTNRVRNVGTAVDDTDAVNKKYLVDNAGSSSWPVGSIYLSMDARNPVTYMGFGTWEATAQGRCIIGAGTTVDARGESRPFNLNQSGGSFQHVLSVDQMPSHAHGHNLTGATSSAGDHTHSMNTTTESMSIHDISGRRFRHGGSLDYTNPAGAHTHTVTISGAIAAQGANNPHNIVQPFLVVNVWRRTA